MDTMALVEMVRTKTGRSYEDCKEALEKNEWNVLNAIIYLEQNNTDSSADRTSAEATSGSTAMQYAVVEATASVKEPKSKKNTSNARIGDIIRKIWSILINNRLVASKKDKTIVQIPLILLLIICAAEFEVSVIVLLVGLFCGVGYKVVGADFDSESAVNDVLKKASDEIHGSDDKDDDDKNDDED